MPMFPLAVARDCMSLKPMRRCAALSVGVLLSAEGAIEAVEPCRSWVKVSYGLTYDDADELIELAPPEDPDLADLAELLKVRTTWREQQGALLMEQAEGRLFRGANAELSLEVTEPGLARSCVSEAMILAGAAMAEWSSQHGLAMPFRVQAGSSQDNPEANQWPQGPVRWAQQRRGLSRSRLQSSARNPMAHLACRCTCRTSFAAIASIGSPPVVAIQCHLEENRSARKPSMRCCSGWSKASERRA